MLALMLMVIVLQNISVSNQHIVYLKCTQCYVSIISQFKKKMKKKSTHTLRQVTIKSSNKPIIILYIRKPNVVKVIRIYPQKVEEETQTQDN